MQFYYVDVITDNPDDKWINLFYGDTCVALIQHDYLVSDMKESINRYATNAENDVGYKYPVVPRERKFAVSGYIAGYLQGLKDAEERLDGAPYTDIMTHLYEWAETALQNDDCIDPIHMV